MDSNTNPARVANSAQLEGKKVLLFYACFVALVATAFGLVVRGFVIDQWGTQFHLTKTQMGMILGAGLWPFGITMIGFSFVLDKIGYKTGLAIAFFLHVLSAIITIMAKGFWPLYWGALIVALANGTVEATVNPVVATLFPHEKVKWINRLHAGWAAGLVVGGILALAMGQAPWTSKVALILLPTALYGVMMLFCKFPIQERVTAGVPYKTMLSEFGFLGALVASLLLVGAVGSAYNWSAALIIGIAIALSVLFGVFCGFKPGKAVVVILVILMIPLATTELGTDSWITDLMTPSMKLIHLFGHSLPGGLVLIYTSLVMMILRMSAGSIVHRIQPLGLLAVAATIAIIGLVSLSYATGITILLAATIYGLGKSFFWPTMMATVAEQSPKGGALTLNATGAIGSLGVGVIGMVFIGYVQDTAVAKRLQIEKPTIYAQVQTVRQVAFVKYDVADPEKVDKLPPREKGIVDDMSDVAKKGALRRVAICPLIMLVTYLLLMGYYSATGGYRAQSLDDYAVASAESPSAANAPPAG